MEGSMYMWNTSAFGNVKHKALYVQMEYLEIYLCEDQFCSGSPTAFSQCQWSSTEIVVMQLK